MKSRQALSIAKIKKTNVPSDQIKNEIDQYVMDVKALQNRVKEIRKLQRNEGLTEEDVRHYWNEAVGRKIGISDERNRLRFIPQEYKSVKHSESGVLGHSERRELRDEIRSLKQQLEDIDSRNKDNKGIKLRKGMQEDLQRDANIQALIRKRVKEAIALKESEIRLIRMQNESLKKGNDGSSSSSSKESPTTNMTVGFELTELTDMMRDLFVKHQQKGTMTIEKGKIVKLE